MNGGVQVIARAAEILRLLQAHPVGLTQAELQAQLGMARSTVSRIINALEDEGLVASCGARGPYRLGPEVARMTHTVRLSVVTDMRPFLEQLSRQLDETVDLSTLDADRVRFVDQVVPPRRLRAISAVGESFPLHCCASGKAILACLPSVHQARVYRGRLVRLTQNTITSPATLSAELVRVRQEGIAYDREEHTEGVCAVAAVLSRIANQLVAVSLPVPAQRFYGREKELSQALLTWVEKVNTTFGSGATLRSCPSPDSQGF